MTNIANPRNCFIVFLGDWRTCSANLKRILPETLKLLPFEVHRTMGRINLLPHSRVLVCICGWQTHAILSTSHGTSGPGDQWCLPAPHKFSTGHLPSVNTRKMVSMARHKSCVHRRAKRQTSRAYSWWEVNPRNTSVLGSECVLVDVNRQDEGKSAHLCLWFNVDLPASSFLSSSLVIPLPPSLPLPPPLSLSLSFPFLTKPFGERRTFSSIDAQQTSSKW